MNMNLFVFTILACFATCALTIDPPVWAQAFTQQFVQADTTGKLWYDYKNNRMRYDMQGSSTDQYCQFIGKDPQTPCTQFIVNLGLYFYFPDKNICCRCCQECTFDVQSPDLYSSFEYMGDADLSGQTFNKWSHNDQNYYDTKDSARVPRRIQSGTFNQDYIVSSYNTNAIDDSVFALKSYCNKSCPSAGLCYNWINAQPKNWFQFLGKNQRKNMKIAEQ